MPPKAFAHLSHTSKCMNTVGLDSEIPKGIAYVLMRDGTNALKENMVSEFLTRPYTCTASDVSSARDMDVIPEVKH